MAVKPVVLLEANVENAALKVYKSFWSNFQEFFEAHFGPHNQALRGETGSDLMTLIPTFCFFTALY